MVITKLLRGMVKRISIVSLTNLRRPRNVRVLVMTGSIALIIAKMTLWKNVKLVMENLRTRRNGLFLEMVI